MFSWRYGKYYKEGYLDHVLNYISNIRKKPFGDSDVWFTHVNMENKLDRKMVEVYNATWLSSKIDAVASEIRGIYYHGNQKQRGVLNECNNKRTNRI